MHSSWLCCVRMLRCCRVTRNCNSELPQASRAAAAAAAEAETFRTEPKWRCYVNSPDSPCRSIATARVAHVEGKIMLQPELTVARDASIRRDVDDGDAGLKSVVPIGPASQDRFHGVARPTHSALLLVRPPPPSYARGAPHAVRHRTRYQTAVTGAVFESERRHANIQQRGRRQRWRRRQRRQQQQQPQGPANEWSNEQQVDEWMNEYPNEWPATSGTRRQAAGRWRRPSRRSAVHSDMHRMMVSPLFLLLPVAMRRAARTHTRAHTRLRHEPRPYASWSIALLCIARSRTQCSAARPGDVGACGRHRWRRWRCRRLWWRLILSHRVFVHETRLHVRALALRQCLSLLQIV